MHPKKDFCFLFSDYWFDSDYLSHLLIDGLIWLTELPDCLTAWLTVYLTDCVIFLYLQDMTSSQSDTLPPSSTAATASAGQTQVATIAFDKDNNGIGLSIVEAQVRGSWLNFIKKNFIMW